MSTEELPFDVDAVTEAALEAADAAGANEAKDSKTVMVDGGISLEEDSNTAFSAAAIRKLPVGGKANQPKKRNRRVGQYPTPNKAVKLEDVNTAGGGEDEDTEEAPAAAATGVTITITNEQGSGNVGRVVTKHDEKWNERYDQ